MAREKQNEGKPKKLKGNHKENQPKVKYTDHSCMDCGNLIEYHGIDEYRHCDKCRAKMDIKASRFDNDFMYCTVYNDLLNISTPERAAL